LCQIQTEADQGFMGDHVLTKPVTTEEIRQMTASVSRELQAMLGTMHSNTAVVAPPVQQSTHLQSSCRCGGINQRNNLNISTSHAGTPADRSQERPDHGTSESEYSPLVSTRPLAVVPVRADLQAPSAPIPGISIPDLGHTPGAWLRAIKQWEENDPSISFKALKDWPETWYTGVMRTKFRAKHSNRKTITVEYERLGRDEMRFCEEYPDADQKMDKLLTSIRKHNTKQRNSKNGMPEERDTK